jgi:CDP-diacylglycerol--glycerol-3-phosphate 3-phosphatidyltransferase/cardiolipin synthase
LFPLDPSRIPAMTWPNRISVFRILLVPCFVASLVYYHPERPQMRTISLILFIIGIVSDALDGFIARSTNQHSPLGSILDPLADKLLILSALISLSSIRGLPDDMRIPAWFNLIVISRDAVVVIGTVLLMMFLGTFPIAPTWLGKCTSALQMLVVPAALLGSPIKMPLLLAAATLTLLSGVSYVRLGMRRVTDAA